MLLKFVTFLTIILGVSGKCMYDTSVDISDGLWFDNGTIAHDDLLYYPDKYIVYNNTVRGCICKIEHCYRKCCARNQIYDEASRSCIDVIKVNLTDDEKELMRHIFREFDLLEELHGLTQVNGQQGLNKCDNTSCVFRTDSYKAHHISEDGDLIVNSVEGYDSKIDVDSYCIDVMIYFNERTQSRVLGREAYFRSKIKAEPKTNNCSYIAMLISIVFIALTLTICVFVPEFRQHLHGRILIAYQSSMLAAFLLLVAMQTSFISQMSSRQLCVYLSFASYFLLLTTFFWMNVVAWDIWKRTRGKPLTFIKEERRKTFLNYSLYGFGVPAALTVLLALLEFAPIEDSKYLPRLRKRECLISGLGKLIYLCIPMSIICIINTIMFLQIVYNSIKRRLVKLCNFWTILKLFIVMGLSWIFEIISTVFPENNAVWMVTDVFNALSGFFIFIIMVCNREKLGVIIKRCCCRCNEENFEPESSLNIVRKIEPLSYLY